MAVTRNSLQYDRLYGTSPAVLARKNDFGGRPMPLPFDHTHPSATVAGDIVNLCKIPANHTVVGMDVSWEAMATTAVIIGTADDTDRFFQSATWATRGKVAGVDIAGMLYTPSVDTIVLATFVTVDPTDLSRFAGMMWVIQAP